MIPSVYSGFEEKRPGSIRRMSGASHGITEYAYDDEEKQHTAVASPSSSTPEEGQRPIDVEAAKAEFESLRRTLSRASSLHRVATGQKSIENADDDDDFDLKDYLVRQRSSSRLSLLLRVLSEPSHVLLCWYSLFAAHTHAFFIYFLAPSLPRCCYRMIC